MSDDTEAVDRRLKLLDLKNRLSGLRKRDTYTDGDLGDVEGVFGELRKLEKKNEKGIDLIQDMEVMEECTELVKDMVHSVKVPGESAPTLENFIDILVASNKWENMAVHVPDEVFYNLGVWIPTNFEVQPKPRVERKSRKGEMITEKSQPSQVTSGAQEQSEQSKRLEKMYKTVSRAHRRSGAPITYAEVSLDRQSFSKTVENLFNLSCLLSEGKIEAIKDKDGKAYLKTSEGDEGTQGVVEHFDVILTADEWKKLVDSNS